MECILAEWQRVFKTGSGPDKRSNNHVSMPNSRNLSVEQGGVQSLNCFVLEYSTTVKSNPLRKIFSELSTANLVNRL